MFARGAKRLKRRLGLARLATATAAGMVIAPLDENALRTAPDEVRAAIIPVRDAYEARWTNLLHSLVDDGHLTADTDVGVARLLLLGGMNATVGWFDPAFGSLDHLTAVAVRQFWDGHARDDDHGRGTPT